MSRTRSLIALSFAAACGGNHASGGAPDAAPAVDGAVHDGAVGDAAAGRGTVHVTMLDPAGSGDHATSGLTVVFFDPDGSVVKKATTDQDGKAAGDVLAGGTVVGISLDTLDTTRYNLFTVLDVHPGDDLTLGTRFATGVTFDMFTITFPPLTGAAGYVVSSPCGATNVDPGPTPVARFAVTAGCKRDTMELVIAAFAGGKIIGSIDTPNVPFTANGLYQETGAWGGVQDLTGSLTHIDPTLTNLTFGRIVPDGVGINTTASAAAITVSTTIAICDAASRIACVTDTRSSRWRLRLIFSISTVASSTSMPIASDRPPSVIMLIV